MLSLHKNFIIVLCLFFWFSSLVLAEALGWLSYTIMPWDTIQSLADAYNIPEDFLRDYNNIDDSMEISWQEIINRAGATIDTLIIMPLWEDISERYTTQQRWMIAEEVKNELYPLLFANTTTTYWVDYNLVTMNLSASMCWYNSKIQWDHALSTIDIYSSSQNIISLDAFEDIEDEVGTIQAFWHQRWEWAWWFAPWYCTDYAAFRRPDLFLLKDGKYRIFGGDAKDWYSSAKKAWLSVGNTPKKWAIAVFYWRGVSRQYGHVAVVEKISVDGKAIVTDMNYNMWRHMVTRRVINSQEPIWYIYWFKK